MLKTIFIYSEDCLIFWLMFGAVWCLAPSYKDSESGEVDCSGPCPVASSDPAPWSGQRWSHVHILGEQQALQDILCKCNRTSERWFSSSWGRYPGQNRLVLLQGLFWAPLSPWDFEVWFVPDPSTGKQCNVPELLLRETWENFGWRWFRESPRASWGRAELSVQGRNLLLPAALAPFTSHFVACYPRGYWIQCLWQMLHLH